MTKEKNTYAVRGPRGYYCEDDRGGVVWEPWPLTTVSAERAREIVQSYAGSTRRGLRIVDTARRP